MTQISAVASLYEVSATTVYRALQAFQKPHSAHRADFGKPRMLPQAELERYCELIAALKLRTTNKAGRHLFTGRAIELMEDHGVETVLGDVRKHISRELLRFEALLDTQDERAICQSARAFREYLDSIDRGFIL